MSSISEQIIAAIKGTEKEFTKGSINKAIFLLSIPMILEMVMESLFAVVDAYFVGQISIDAVATVGITESVITIVYSIAVGISAAATAMVSRRIGENQAEKAAVAAAQAILLSVSLSILIGILGIIFAEDILRLMGATESMISSGLSYTRIILGSNIVITLLFLLNGIFRGAGDAALAMRSLWLANILNIILDPLLIFGIGFFPEMGVKGAAVATTIGRGTGVLFQLYILFRGSSLIRLKWAHFKAQWTLIKRLINVAIGGAGQHIIASASWIFMMRIISFFGSEAVAGYTFAIRVIIFTILPAWGMANAAATLVGQNLGANQAERAEISVWRTAFLCMVFLLSISVFFYIFAAPIIGIFTDNANVIREGAMGLQIFSIGYVAYAYAMVISQSFNGAGDTRTPTFINFVCFWLLEIPLGYFLAINMEWNTAGVYWAVVISEVVLAIIAVVLFRRGRWKTVQI